MTLSRDLEKIARLPEPEGKLDNLHLFIAGILKDVIRSGRVPQFPLLDTLRLARKSFEECRSTFPTAESTFHIRTGLDSLLRGLGIVTLARLGLNETLKENSDRFLKHVSKHEDSEDAILLEAYHRLLVSTTNWILAHYEKQPFCKALTASSPAQKEKFQSQRERLAEKLSHRVVKPTESEAVASIVDELRYLRGQVQAKQPVITENNDQPFIGVSSDIVDLFLIDLSGLNSSPLLIVFAADTEAFHVCSSRVLEQAIEAYDQILKDRPSSFPELDEFFQIYSAHRHLQICELLNCEDDRHAGQPQHIRYYDLTLSGLPLPELTDPNHRFNWSRECRPHQNVSPSNDLRRIAFWGNIQFDRDNPLFVDSQHREVRFREAPEMVLKYPHCKNEKPKYLAVTEKPLPYTVYEQWFLEDLCRTIDAPLTVYSELQATRSAFLTTDWSSYSVLHLSTHGKAFSAIPECSMVRMALKDRVFFTDIMTIDWSNLELVFLNACLTNLGKTQKGEAAISLGWAFLAGGAKSVIATRWTVPDDAAFLFAKYFYESWLGVSNRPSVEEAFTDAQRKLRQDPHCSSPHQWGGFVLLK